MSVEFGTLCSVFSCCILIFCVFTLRLMEADKRSLDVAIEGTRIEMGYSTLKEKQIEAIAAFAQGKDTVVILPTGYGKSIIYSMIPFVFDKIKGQQGSIVVCVSPLTSLMMDQQRKLAPRGLSCECVGEAQNDETAVKRVLSGKVQLVFISPESLLKNPMYRCMLLKPRYKELLVGLVVDEAHCVKTWGDDFRVAFAHIGDLRSLLPEDIHIMALTATATRHAFDCIVNRLSLRDMAVIAMPPDRKNIHYSVKPMTTIEEFGLALAAEFTRDYVNVHKTVVFCRRYNDCSFLYLLLQEKLGRYFTYPVGAPNLQLFRLVDIYTSASTVSMREQLLTSFTDSGHPLRLLIATTAFGMGVDCRDIRRIIHWGPPREIEDYVQETGRAGRDGLDSYAILMFGRVRTPVSARMKDYAENKTVCRRKNLFSDFMLCSDIESVESCSCCDICALKDAV